MKIERVERRLREVANTIITQGKYTERLERLCARLCRKQYAIAVCQTYWIQIAQRSRIEDYWEFDDIFVLLTDDPESASLARSLRNHGREGGGLRPPMVRLGYNGRVSELQAIVALERAMGAERT